jgi:hypothetical protein
VRRFTGLANYYRRFVEGYAEVAAPLTALQPYGEVRVVAGGAGKLRRAEVGPLHGTGAAYVRPTAAGCAYDGR